MSLNITGIKIKHVWVGEEDNGKDKITASYQLLTDGGKTIGSKETLSTSTGYGETTFSPSPQTIKALRDAVTLYRKDVEASLGLTTS